MENCYLKLRAPLKVLSYLSRCSICHIFMNNNEVERDEMIDETHDLEDSEQDEQDKENENDEDYQKE